KVEMQEGGERKERLTCFMTELPAEGWTAGPPAHKLATPPSWTNAITIENLRIPVENVIGGIGQGFKVAMGVLNHGRMGLAAGCVAGAKNALARHVTRSHARGQLTE